MNGLVHSYQQLANEFEAREKRAWMQQIRILRDRLQIIMSYYNMSSEDELSPTMMDQDDVVEALLIIEEIKELEQYVK